MRDLRWLASVGRNQHTQDIPETVRDGSESRYLRRPFSQPRRARLHLLAPHGKLIIVGDGRDEMRRAGKPLDDVEEQPPTPRDPKFSEVPTSVEEVPLDRPAIPL